MVYETFKKLAEGYVEKHSEFTGTLVYYEVSDYIGVIALLEDDTKFKEGLLVYNGPENGYKWSLLEGNHSSISSKKYIEFIDHMYEAVHYNLGNAVEDSESTNFGIDLDI